MPVLLAACGISPRVTKRTYTIGMLLPDFTHPFFGEIAKAIAETVRPHGYHVIISYFEEDPGLQARETDSLLARQVDGLIIASASRPTVWICLRGFDSGKCPMS